MKKTLIITTAIIAVLFVGFATSDNDFFVGDGADTDKKIGVNIGSGATNPFIKYNTTDDVWQFSNDGTTVADFGSGSGGGGVGGAINWSAEAGSAPIYEVEHGLNLYSFGIEGQYLVDIKATTLIKVPDSYVAGDQITMTNYFYTNASSGKYRFKTTTYLVRFGTDDVNSTTNSNVDILSPSLVVSGAKQIQNYSFQLTDALGQINSVSVSPGDYLRVELSRMETGLDVEDYVKFIADATEVSFTP